MEKAEAERKVEESVEEDDQVVNPWQVSTKDGGKIDYDKLIDKFGCQRLQQSLVERVQRLTSRPPHVFLRRGVFFAHRFISFSLDIPFCSPIIAVVVLDFVSFSQGF